MAEEMLASSSIKDTEVSDDVYVEMTNVVGQVTGDDSEVGNSTRHISESFSVDATLEMANKVANGLFSANLVEVLNKCSGVEAQVREGMATRKSADVVDTVLTIYNLLSANDEYLNLMKKIKSELGEDHFKLLLGDEFKFLDPDSKENQELYNKKKVLDITKTITSLSYLLSEQAVTNEYVPLISSFLYIVLNTMPEIFEKYRGITKDVERQNDSMKTFLDNLKKNLKEADDDIEQGDSPSSVVGDKKNNILSLLSSKCDGCYSVFDNIKKLNPIQVIMDSMSTISLVVSSTLAAHDINKFISERDGSTGCHKDLFEAKKTASAASLGIMIPEYALLVLRHTYGFIKSTTKLVTTYGESTKKEVTKNILGSLVELLGAASGVLAGYTLYNTAQESEEKTMEKLFIANTSLTLACLAKILDKRNDLFGHIHDAGSSVLTGLSSCCSCMCEGITSMFGGTKKETTLTDRLLTKDYQDLSEVVISTNPEVDTTKNSQPSSSNDKPQEYQWVDRVAKKSDEQESMAK